MFRQPTSARAGPMEAHSKRPERLALTALTVLVVGSTVYAAIRTYSPALPIMAVALLAGGGFAAALCRARWTSLTTPLARALGWLLLLALSAGVLWLATNQFGATLPGTLLLPRNLAYSGHEYRPGPYVAHMPPVIGANVGQGLMFDVHGLGCERGLGNESRLEQVGTVRVPFERGLPVFRDRLGGLGGLWLRLPQLNCYVSYDVQFGG